MLDLIFSNISFVTAEVTDMLYAGVDHSNIFIIILYEGYFTYDQYRPSISDNKLNAFAELVIMGVGPLLYLPDMSTLEQLDKLIQKLIDVLILTIKAVGKPVNKAGYNVL